MFIGCTIPVTDDVTQSLKLLGNSLKPLKCVNHREYVYQVDGTPFKIKPQPNGKLIFECGTDKWTDDLTQRVSMSL